MVQSILTLRFDNPIIQDNWNKDHIKSIEINAFESLGVEKRAGYYDKVGALKDMVHSHLLQLLALMALEKPKDMTPESIRAAKVAVLKQLRPIQENDLSKNVTFGQYQGYQNEPGVAKNSTTDTYTSIKAYIDSPRWKNVPFYITTGKKLSKKITEIIVHFKANRLGYNNDLYLEVDPTINIKLSFNILNPEAKNVTSHPIHHPERNEGSPTHDTVPECRRSLATLGMTCEPLPKNKIESIWLSTDEDSSLRHWTSKDYDKLIYDVVQGDHTLFVTSAEIEESWRWIDNISYLKQLKHIVPMRYSFDKKK